MTAVPQTNSLTKEDKKEYANNIMKDMEALHASLFGSAKNSANLMILAGYAVTFITWGLTKGSVSLFLSGLTGLLLIVSLVSFMSFEIYKILKTVGSQVKFINNVKSLDTADNVISAFEVLKKDKTTNQQDILKVWYLCFTLCSLTGFSAMAIMLYNCVNRVITNV